MTSGTPRTGLCAAAILILLAACATPQEQVQAKEDMLASAGFELHPADNAKRKELLQNLPPHHLVMRDVHGSYVYMYSDPWYAAAFMSVRSRLTIPTNGRCFSSISPTSSK